MALRLTLSLAPMLLIAPACAPVETAPVALTAKQAEKLDKQLSGKTPGTPQNCITRDLARDSIRVSDDLLLYRVSKGLTYRNNLRGRCTGLARDSDIMVIETFGGSYCKGDLIRLVDRSSGIPGGFCSLGEFIPYRAPKAG